METVANEGRTVLFVSHNLAAVQKLCPRSIMLSRGRLVMEASTDEVMREYLRSVRHDTAAELSSRTDRAGSGRLRFTEVRFELRDPRDNVPRTGQDLDVVLSYE